VFLFALHLLLTRQSIINGIYKVVCVGMVIQLRIYRWEWNVYVC